MSLVVVVLPLVPVTRTTWRPTASRDSRSGARRRLMTPPMTEPAPFPARRDRLGAVRRAASARPGVTERLTLVRVPAPWRGGAPVPHGRLWAQVRARHACG